MNRKDVKKFSHHGDGDVGPCDLSSQRDGQPIENTMALSSVTQQQSRAATIYAWSFLIASCKGFRFSAKTAAHFQALMLLSDMFSSLLMSEFSSIISNSMF